MRSLSTWFAYGFAVLTVAALTVAAILNFHRPAWFWFWCGVVLGSMSIVFLILENIAGVLLLAFLERFDKERKIAEGLHLAASLPDDDLRRRLYIALSLHLCGARAANSAVPQVVHASRNGEPRVLPLPVVQRGRGRERGRGRRRGRRRGGRRGGRRALVQLRCC